MKGYRTLIVAALLALFGALLVALPALQKQIDPEWYGWIFLVVSVVVAVLRAITDSPIFKAVQKQEQGNDLAT